MCAKFYTKEEQELALNEFERLGSITAVIHKLVIQVEQLYISGMAQKGWLFK